MSNRPYPPNPNDSTIQDPRVMYEARQQANYTGGQQVESSQQRKEDINYG